jgi:nucleoside-diphosphate-sugar epimerase
MSGGAANPGGSAESGGAAAVLRGVPLLITGGGGFVGRALAEKCAEAGARVRTFARGDYPALQALGIEHIRGDLADAGAVLRAAEGCAVVFHVAAKAGVWGPYDDFYAANVRGTENVIAACRSAGISTLVYTSSPSVVFGGHDMEGVDESALLPERHASHYSATKAIAERAVLAAGDANLRTCALRPHLIWGPRDNHIIPRILKRAKQGRLRIVGDGTNRVDVTYIDNCVHAHLCAAAALLGGGEAADRAAGRAYFISDGTPVNAWAFINRILEAAGLPPLRRKISRRAARTLGAMFEFVYSAFGVKQEPPMTRFLADELATSHWFDIRAARTQLHYAPPVTTEQGLERLRLWLRQS